jgi:hypothetical protein
LTLDEDVAAKLKDETRRTGRPFRDVVNDTLRRGLLTCRPKRAIAISLPQFALGVCDGIDLDNAERVLDDLSRRPNR